MVPRRDVLFSRSMSLEQQQTLKISCQKPRFDLLSEWKFLPIEHKNALQVNNSERSPDNVARQIIQHLSFR